MPKDTDFAHNSFWQTSDAIFIGALAVGLGIHYLKYPLHIVAGISTLRIILGASIISAGTALIVSAKVAFKRSHQPSAPRKPTTTVVRSGIFRYSRNPVYTGLILVFFGIGLTSNILWLVILTLPVVLLFKHVLILPEEHYLLGKFGETYADYMSHVRRWL